MAASEREGIHHQLRHQRPLLVSKFDNVQPKSLWWNVDYYYHHVKQNAILTCVPSLCSVFVIDFFPEATIMFADIVGALLIFDSV